MYKTRIPLYLLCESALHVGSGNDLGDIDLPIQREKHTGFPKVESSSLKGAIRQAVEAKVGNQDFRKLETGDVTDAVKVHRVFGMDDSDLGEDKTKQLRKALSDGIKDNTDYASAIAFTDARLLLFPVCSLKGIFAWVTCPRVLKKFQYELTEICNHQKAPTWKIPKENTTTNTCSLFTDEETKKQIQLDEYLYTNIKSDKDCTALAKWLSEVVFKDTPDFWQDKVNNDLIVLSDDDFKSFVTFSTEVITRIKINGKTGTVEQGGLFSEEYLPAESVLYSLTMFSDEFRAKDPLKAVKVSEFFKKNLPKYFQLGGNATLGKGIIKPIF